MERERLICRTCRKENSADDCFSVCNETLNTKTIADMIYEISDVLVHRDHCLPQFICMSCHGQLLVAYKFRLQCIESNEILSNQFGISRKEVNTTGPDFSKLDIKVGAASDLQSLVKEEELELHEFEIINKAEGTGETYESDSSTQTSIRLSQYKSSQYLISHESKYYNLVKFTVQRCCGCDDFFLPLHELRVHCEESHNVDTTGADGTGSSRCPICFRVFSSRTSREAHRRAWESRLWYHCKLCDMMFPNVLLILKHLEQLHSTRVHEQYKLEEKLVPTDDNSPTLNDYHPDQYQILQVKAGYRVFRFNGWQCCGCNKILKTKRCLKEHAQEVHLNDRIERSKKTQIRCDTCFRRFPFQRTLLAHKQLQSKQRIACNYCKLIMTFKSQFTSHKAKVHPNESDEKLSSENDMEEPLEQVQLIESEDDYQPDVESDNDEDQNDLNLKQNKLHRRRFLRSQLLRRYPQKYLKELSDYGTFKVTELTKHICCGCGEFFDSMDSLKLHCSSNHLKNPSEQLPNMFECDLCGMQTSNALTMMHHRKRQAQKQFYFCKLCKVMVESEARFRNHMKLDEAHAKHFDVRRSDITNMYTVASSAARKCCKCSASFGSMEAVLAHATEKHSFGGMKNSTTTCPICGKRFRSKRELQNHEEEATQQLSYCCKQCDFTSTRKHNIENHLNSSIHNNKELFSLNLPSIEEGLAIVDRLRYCCFPNCNKPFVTVKLLLEHASLAHADQKAQTQLGSSTGFQCDCCARYFNVKTALLLHQRKQTPQKKHICSYCGKVLNNEVHLLSHERTHTGERPFECELCAKGFTSKMLLTAHKKTHNERTLQCTVCGKRFNREKNLSRHMEYSHSETTLQCPQCPMQLKCKEALGRHLRRHTGEKPYKCRTEGCERYYADPTDRKRHEMSAHTMERPHKCSYCDAGFVRKRQMLIHERKQHTGERPFGCDKCNRGFIEVADLKKHKC